MTIFFCPLCQDYSLFFYTNYEVEQHHFEHHQVEQHLVAHCQVEQHQVEQQQVEQQQVVQQQVEQHQDQKVVFFCPVCQDAKLLFSSNHEVKEHKKGCFPHECKVCNLIAFGFVISAWQFRFWSSSIGLQLFKSIRSNRQLIAPIDCHDQTT